MKLNRVNCLPATANRRIGAPTPGGVRSLPRLAVSPAWTVGGVIGLAVLALLLAGCQVTHVAQPHQPAGATVGSASTGKGGAQLWGENCVRCHNIRSPSSYNDAEWDVAMHHMRIRANLTAEEHRKVMEFLKSAN